mgnify:CR=1 FL=1
MEVEADPDAGALAGTGKVGRPKTDGSVGIAGTELLTRSSDRLIN